MKNSKFLYIVLKIKNEFYDKFHIKDELKEKLKYLTSLVYIIKIISIFKNFSLIKFTDDLFS